MHYMVTKCELRNTASEQRVQNLVKELRKHVYRFVLVEVERNYINEILVKSKFVLVSEISHFYDTCKQQNLMAV